MGIGLLHREKNECDDCQEKFSSYDELIIHARDVHKRHVIKCRYCGKQFIHEKDRLHHEREEKEKKVDFRRHKF
jgi:DNA-directed RNA polymerase subunit M/transcription elongation factor TFIIS